MFKTEKDQQKLHSDYEILLKMYLNQKSEQILYHAGQYSKQLLDTQVSPEELISLHYEVLKETDPELPESIKDSFDFLLEVMIGYGLALREHQSLRDKQRELELQIEVAANMQQSLLPKTLPQIEHVDIGVTSVPATKVSGDYYYCVEKEKGSIGLAIADIIGKGIPAAMSMSMIKYAIDSLSDFWMEPHLLLENLNRVVEQNVDESMFITMLYGLYNPKTHQFSFANAGHEPGFFYKAKEDHFEELFAKGLVLGVDPSAVYRQYSVTLDKGDAIILLSDGVTEARIENHFIERTEIINVIKKYIHLPAQQLTEKVYRELAELQDFTLEDDFTFMVLKRKV